MNLFLRKFFGRLVIFLCLLTLVFFVKLPRSYYFSIPERTDFSKMTWVENKLNNTESLDNTVIFVGSSICLNGINDSLLNSLDSSGTSYLNLGVTHTCYAIVDVMLEDILLRRGMKPKKVMLCFKGDAMARNIHNMYALAAPPSHILASATEGNTLFLPSFLKHASWNIHAATREFKFDEGEDRLRFVSNYGFAPKHASDSLETEKIYKRLKAGSEANFSAIERETQGQAMSWKTKLLLTQVDYTENIRFQRESFEASARLLDEQGIDYDIVLYPNMISSRMGKPHLMADYIRHTFTGIDYSRHKILVMTDPAFSDARNYVDMNHLSEEGADLLTREVFRQMQAE